ncbi:MULTISPECIES: heavy metal-responsive transcriptional regulator [Lentzea]|uniref:heavy metal-responsive transcriptional regulator n=1 Tax=Lentzea TaxID=165301 RepID=UPI000AE660B2
MSTKTIRFYEQSGLLPAPPRTSGGYRDYPEQAIARLAFVRNAQSAGLTLAEISSVLALRDGGQAPCGHVTALISERLADIERRLAEMTKTRDALRGLVRRGAVTDPATCTENDICTIINPAGHRPRPAHHK